MGMQVCEIQLQCEVGQVEDLAEDERDLVEAARSASEKAYAPYSGFFVGAAVLCANGQTYIGSNQETAAFDGLHAERSALSAAAMAGQGDLVRKIAVMGHPKDKESCNPTAPCGGCRQCLVEYEDRAGQALVVIMAATNGEVWRVVGVRKNLLPMAFGPADFV